MNTILENVVETICDADDPKGQTLRAEMTIAEVEQIYSVTQLSNVSPVVA